jgi:POT family proton-dependent oligopeptide transporter
MSAGMFIAAGAFATSGVLEERINAVGDGVINVVEQLPQYFLLTVAEILVSTTGLEFAFVEAGPHLKSAVLALFFLTTAAGDLLNGALYSALGGFTAAKLIWIVTGLQVVAAACFVAVARTYVTRQARELGAAEAARAREGAEVAPSADVGDEREGDGATLGPSSG